MLCRYTLLGGRRASGRRRGEVANVYVDQHGPALLAVVLGVAGLNVLDAFYTMFFLAHGGQELNPIVDALICTGAWAFLLAKFTGVSICAAFLVLTKNFRASRIGLAIVGVGYAALLGWHLYLAGLMSRFG
jgi:hypothetical protein